VRRNAIVALGVVILLVASGCAGGVASYHPVRMDRDLDAASLARYQAEAQEATAGGGAPHMAVLEHTNWWPLGIFLYWRQGTVQVMGGADGQPVYMVSASAGYGPLSVFYVSGTDAMFDADGKRLSAMGMASILWGHLAMFHDMGSLSPDGKWSQHSSSAWLHHLINLSTMHGETSWSIFSSPGPVGAGR
jgi:hypothetical protein